MVDHLLHQRLKCWILVIRDVVAAKWKKRGMKLRVDLPDRKIRAVLGEVS